MIPDPGALWQDIAWFVDCWYAFQNFLRSGGC